MTNTRLTDPEVLEWRFPVLHELFLHPERPRYSVSPVDLRRSPVD